MKTINYKSIWAALALGLLLTSCATARQTIPARAPKENILEESKALMLNDFGPAPELENEIWLNTDSPLRLANLRGKVVLLDMWTFG